MKSYVDLGFNSEFDLCVDFDFVGLGFDLNSKAGLDLNADLVFDLGFDVDSDFDFGYCDDVFLMLISIGVFLWHWFSISTLTSSLMFIWC